MAIEPLIWGTAVTVDINNKEIKTEQKIILFFPNPKYLDLLVRLNLELKERMKGSNIKYFYSHFEKNK